MYNLEYRIIFPVFYSNFVKYMHARGLQVCAWTVNDEHEMVSALGGYSNAFTVARCPRYQSLDIPTFQRTIKLTFGYCSSGYHEHTFHVPRSCHICLKATITVSSVCLLSNKHC